MTLREQLQSTLGDGYAIDRELGGGGMSRVFLATEKSLGRQIVVKVVPPDTVQQVSIERFKREIQFAASLQHPHIVPLLFAGESDGLPFYTMPFVRGEALRERLALHGELSVKETIHILRDVAAALAYAHAEGVVHRDIKPENIIVSGGVAVVTDFGVAKAMDVAATAGGSAASGLTSLGVALGTPAYMAPEQATADPKVDHRVDIYAFGCVAYEMLSGASPFAGRPPQQILAAHVTETPVPLSTRRPSVPPALADLVAKCLEKLAGDRPQSANEILAALDAIATPSGGMAPTDARLPALHQSRRRWYVAGAVLAALGAVAAVALRPRPEPPLVVGATTAVAVTTELEMEPAISPDGKLVAYSAGSPGERRIFVQQIGAGRPVLLTSELSGDHARPRWSPDGARIVFEANQSLYIVPALGGTPRRVPISEAGPITPAWSPDGRELAYSVAPGIVVAPVDGGEARVVASGATLHSPTWSADGKMIAYIDGIPPSLGNLAPAAIWVVSRATGERQQVTDNSVVNLSPAWTPDGRSLLFISTRDGPADIYQQPVSADGVPIGTPRRVTTGLSARAITLSSDGSRVAYDLLRNRSNIWTVAIPSSGTASMSAATQVTNEAQRIEGLGLSRDGEWLAYDSDRGGNADIYKVRIAGGAPVQLTTTAANDFAPSWSPGDREIAFHSLRGGKREIYLVSSEGGPETQVTREAAQVFNPTWSPDGNQLAYFAIDSTRRRTTRIVKRDGNGRWSAHRVLTPDSMEAAWVRWSPDGRLIAFVTPLNRVLTPSSGGSVTVIPPDGGAPLRLFKGDSSEVALFIAWAKDANVLYYCTRRGSRTFFWSVPVSGGPRRMLLQDDPAHRISRADFVTDGRRLFFTRAADESDVYVMALSR